MTAEETNVALLREAYARWAESRGASVDEWCAVCDEQIALGPGADGAPGLEFTAAASGREGLRAYLAGVAADWEMLSFEVAEYVAQGERVVAVIASAWRHRRTGKRVDLPKVDLWRFRDGRAVEFRDFYDTAKAIAGTQP